MNLALDPYLERMKLFINEPTFRLDVSENIPSEYFEIGSEKYRDLIKAIENVCQCQEEKLDTDVSIRTLPSEQISVTELRHAVQRVNEFEYKLTSMENISSDFGDKIQMNIAEMKTHEDQISKIAENLNIRYQNLANTLSEIEKSKKQLEHFFCNKDYIKKLNDENDVLRSQLAKIYQEKIEIIKEKPLMNNNEVKKLEMDLSNVKDQKTMLERQLNEERNKNKALLQANESLSAEKKTLQSKIQFQDNDLSINGRDLSEIQAQNSSLEKNIFLATAEIQQFKKNGQGPLSSIQIQKDFIENQEMKKLIEQNEKLILELNELKRQKLKIPNPESIKNVDGKDLFLLNKREFELDKDNKGKDAELRLLLKQLEHEKALNMELSQSFKTLEHRHKQLQNDYNSLKQSARNTNAPTTPGRSNRENNVLGLSLQNLSAHNLSASSQSMINLDNGKKENETRRFPSQSEQFKGERSISDFSYRNFNNMY